MSIVNLLLNLLLFLPVPKFDVLGDELGVDQPSILGVVSNT
ncbi:hypothetical protein [Paraglaciecola sp.]